MKKNYEIPISKPNLNDKDFQEIKKCFYSSWISSKSPWVDNFERLFTKKVSQTKYAVSTNSGTSALFLALKVLRIGIGDEVILPTFTMIATINAVIWTGAKPVLVDCESKNDWNISLSQLEKKINKKTKAIIPVHVYGYMASMDKILAIAKKYRLFIIEDAAEAMGSTYRQKNAGSFGHISCFSLYANKIVTTGNGGILCTNSKNIYHLAKKLAFFDFNKAIHFKHYLIGYNLVLSGLQAALGYSQLKKFPRLLQKRRLIYLWYKEYLKEIKGIRLILPKKDQQPNYWFPAIIAKNKRIKKKVIYLLTKYGVETRNFFLPLHLQPVFKDIYKKERFPHSEYFSSCGFLLPSYYSLKKSQVAFISEIIKKAANNGKKRISKNVSS